MKQLTVGTLKEILELFTDDTIITAIVGEYDGGLDQHVEEESSITCYMNQGMSSLYIIPDSQFRYIDMSGSVNVSKMIEIEIENRNPTQAIEELMDKKSELMERRTRYKGVAPRFIFEELDGINARIEELQEILKTQTAT